MQVFSLIHYAADFVKFSNNVVQTFVTQIFKICHFYFSIILLLSALFMETTAMYETVTVKIINTIHSYLRISSK